MTIVSPSASQREIADGLNRLAGRIGTGRVTLGSGASTIVTDPRAAPGSVVLLSGAGVGAVAGTVVPAPGAGTITFMSGAGRAGEQFVYVIVNL
jgi:hypothetical protein